MPGQVGDLPHDAGKLLMWRRPPAGVAAGRFFLSLSLDSIRLLAYHGSAWFECVVCVAASGGAGLRLGRVEDTQERRGFSDV